MAWSLETIAEHMTGVADEHIPRVDLKVYRLRALTPECDDLGLREIQYMAMHPESKCCSAVVVNLRW